MPISFAGVDLIHEDPDGDVQGWLDHWLDLDDNRMVAAWPSAAWNKSGGVPLPNYSHVLRPKLNTWYRPVGASRWSFGLFLADTATKDRILSAVGTGNPGKTLRIEAPEGFGRSWLAYLLPVHPISDDVSADDGIWILPIVDERWWWQFRNAELGLLTDSTTWTTVLSTLAANLGITLNFTSIYSTYGSPNVTRFNSANTVNAAILLDAAAHAVGRKVMLQYLDAGGDNYYQLVYTAALPAESVTRREFNFTQASAGSLQTGILAAGALNQRGVIPSSIRVIFRKYANGIIWDGEHYIKTLSASALGYSGSTTDYVKSFTTTALADYTTGSGTPDNVTDCDNLATQIATDFLDSVNWIQDSNYIGVSRWIETGFDDYVEFSIGRRRRDGSLECKTRIHSLPYNQTCEEMWHQVPNTHEYGDVIEGKLDGSLASEGTATLSVYESSDTSTPPSDTGRNLIVTDWYGFTGSAGQRLLALKAGKQWRPSTEACTVF